MEKLKSSGLFGNGLLEITQPHLVERYNKCLADIGLKTTNLTSFSIDAMGWSPEIAEEHNNKYYLSHSGVANPYAIILSPKQEGRPVYFPFHSFDYDMMRIVFHSSREQIQELTTQTAIWIDIDQEITNYRVPQDLLMIDTINLRFYTPNRLMQEVRKQRKLVQRFYEEKYSWGDNKLMNAILESCQENGDLRFRSLDMPDIPYNHLRSFYTRAFSGLFIFRHAQNEKPLLIFEKEKSQFSGSEEFGHIEYDLYEPALIDKLFKEELVVFDVRLFKKDTSHFERIQEYIFIDAYSRVYPNEPLTLSHDGHKRSKLMELSVANELSEVYFELEKLKKQIQSGGMIAWGGTPYEMKLVLAQPNPKLDDYTKNVVWQLLAKLYPKDIIWMYGYDKEKFFDNYLSWPVPKKEWAVHYLKKYYVPYYSE